MLILYSAALWICMGSNNLWLEFSDFHKYGIVSSANTDDLIYTFPFHVPLGFICLLVCFLSCLMSLVKISSVILNSDCEVSILIWFQILSPLLSEVFFPLLHGKITKFIYNDKWHYNRKTGKQSVCHLRSHLCTTNE